MDLFELDGSVMGRARMQQDREREFIIDNLLVRIHLIIVMIWWTGFAPREFEFPFPGSLISTFLEPARRGGGQRVRGRRPLPLALFWCFFIFVITLQPRVE